MRSEDKFSMLSRLPLTDRSARFEYRVFMNNLPYKVKFGAIKDFFRNHGIDKTRVEILEDLDQQRGLGCAIIDFENDEDLQKGLLAHETSFEDRTIWIQADPNNRLSVSFLKKKGYNPIFKGNKGMPFITANAGSKRKADDNDFDFPKRSRSEMFQSQPPRMQMPQQMNRFNKDSRGRFLVDNLKELCASVIFYNGFTSRNTLKDVEKCFEKFGKVDKVKAAVYKDGTSDHKRGLVYFVRARDAERAMMEMANGYDFEGNGRVMIKIRPAGETRDMPEGLSNINRPMPESECAQICKDVHKIDPFGPCRIFFGGIDPQWQHKEDWILDVVNFVGDVYSLQWVYSKERIVLGCTVQYSAAYDAQQAIHVLNDAILDGKKLIVKVDFKGLDAKREKDASRLSRMPDFINNGIAPVVGQMGMVGGMGQNFVGQPQVMPQMPQQMMNNMPPPQMVQNKWQNTIQTPPTGTPLQTPTIKEDVNTLAARLGISSKMVEALRVIASEGKEEPTVSSFITSNKSAIANGIEANRNGFKSIPTQSFSPQKPGAKKWTPTTNDTLYFRNLPKTLTEFKLREMMGAFGRINFVDFPIGNDGFPVGYAYIKYDQRDLGFAIDSATKRWNGQTLENNVLDVGLY